MAVRFDGFAKRWSRREGLMYLDVEDFGRIVGNIPDEFRKMADAKLRVVFEVDRKPAEGKRALAKISNFQWVGKNAPPPSTW